MAPPDLSTYPDSVKLMFWQWVTDSALVVKDRELSKGWDKDGQIHPLHRETIKHRKSEVGPVTKTAPRLEPALKRSRVRSLLRGRAHHSSAELYWDFDAVTGDSFAVILHYQAEEYGHDVFGLSDRGTAQVRREALDKWQAWKVEAGHARPRVDVPGTQPIPKREVKKPIPKREVKGRMDLENFDISSSGEKLKQAIEAGQFSGFRRLNARGEQWKPGTRIPPAPQGRGPGPAPGPPKPRPAQPPAILVPSVVQPPKQVHPYIVMGKVDKDRHLEFDKMIQGLPEGVKVTLKKADIRHVLATKVIDYYPELEKVQPKGWPAGMTWEHSEGLAQWGSKRVVIATHLKNLAGEYVPTYRFRATFYHETGHGVDLSLGRPVPLEGFEFSAQKPWHEAWTADVAKLTPSQKLKFAYYLQPGSNGPQETFAELFANFHGESVTPGEMLQDSFPECKALLAKTLEALK